MLKMRSFLKIFILGAAVVAAAGCSKSRAEQMKLAEKLQIDCTPEVLALVGDQIPVDLAVTYPDGYFHPKALLEVTPVLVYAGGEEQKGPTFVYQGEKVLDNYKVVAKSGGTVKEHFAFDYEEGMEQAYLELRGVARYKDKEIAIPAVKVADGTVVTQLLAEADGEYSYKKDNYQAVLHEQTEGQVMYDYNSATIKGSELRSRSIKELQAALEAIEADPRYTVRGTSVVAYASPEGGEAYNAKLSDKRAASAQKAWSKVTGEKAPDNLEVRSIGQDWEGFREAVENSDIEDKDLILRVLSMYSDPAVRENFSDEELVELSQKAIDVLDEEGLLRVASITDNAARKAELYEKAVQKYASDRARFNLACLALDDRRPDAAAKYLDAIKDQDAAVLNAKGVVALQRGDRKTAADWFRKAGTGEAMANLGLVELLDGNYDAAAKRLEGVHGVNGAIASLLAGRIDEAEARVTCKCARAEYVRAIIAARRGDAEGVRTHLANVEAKSKALYEKSRKDVEFAKFR